MLVGQNLKKVVIIGSNRIPFSRSNSVYATSSNKDMMTAALNGLIDRYNLANKLIGEVAGGAVIKHSRDFNLIRESVLSTKLDPRTPGCDLQQACDTGIEAAVYIANKIALGQIDVGIAGGTDTTSDAPIGVSEPMRRILLEAFREKKPLGKIKKLLQIRPQHFAVSPPKNIEPRTKMSMGQHAQIAADIYGVSRTDQDLFAYESHMKLAKAYNEGFFDDLISPYNGLTKDNNMRPDSTLEKLATLRGVFGGSGTMTAGNSTPLTDGASCVLLASEEYAKKEGLPIQAYLKTVQLKGIEFVQNKENLLMAPVRAVPAMLKNVNMSLQDFDFYEIHEAFASQVLATLSLWEDTKFCKHELGLDKALGKIDRTKLNIKGSSIAAGHPFAATGGRIIGTLAKIIDQNQGGKGLISICAAGGMGLTAILEK